MIEGCSLVAHEFPFGSRSPIDHHQSVVALDAARHRVLRQRVLAGGMAALQAAEPRLHIRKRRVVVAIGTERITLKVREDQAVT